MRRGNKRDLIAEATRPGAVPLPKHRPKAERMLYLAKWRALAQAYPDRCVLCNVRTDHNVSLQFVDILGGGGVDGDFDGPLCEQCLTAGRDETMRVIQATTKGKA